MKKKLIQFTDKRYGFIFRLHWWSKDWYVYPVRFLSRTNARREALSFKPGSRLQKGGDEHVFLSYKILDEKI